MAKLAKNDDAEANTQSLGGTSGSPARIGDDRSASVPISRHELIAVVLVTLVGIGLRVAFPSRMAVEHFDEGVYASNIFFDAEQGYRFPNQHLYAPPLLPWLIEMVFILFGPSNVGAMVPSLIAGCLTVPLLWWVGRRWFGPTAGLAASILCATNDIHILFSRSALTDVLLCFWLLLAVYLFWETITRDHFGWAIAAGVATSLAWWTKYTGWLTLAITSAGLALSWLLDRRTRAGWKRHAVCWLITAGVAALLWSPWLWSLQPHGGYSAVATNHRGYVVGWDGWWESLWTHGQNEGELEDILTALGLILVFVLDKLGTSSGGRWCFTWNERVAIRTWSVPQWIVSLPDFIVFGLIMAMCSSGDVPFYLVFLAYYSLLLPGCLIAGRETRQLALGEAVSQTFAFGLLFVLMFGLAASIPMYAPYPRLAIPLFAAAWIAFGMISRERWLAALPTSLRTRSPIRQAIGAVILLALMGLAMIPSPELGLRRPEPPYTPGWRSRAPLAELTNLIRASSRTSRDVGELNISEQIAFYVYGEPALYFQLRLAGAELVRPVEHLAFARAGEPVAPVPVFLVTGPHAERNPNFARQFDEVKDRLKLVKEYEYQPSDLVWRDQRREFDTPPKFHVKLYRVE